jgi:hypothetical protein
MKITKKKLKRINREHNKRLMNEARPARRPARGTAEGDVQDLVDSLLRNLRTRSQALAQQVASDEVYIMTGEAEGVTVRVLRRGR